MARLHDAEGHADSELRADVLAYGAMCWELGADAMGTDPRAGRTWLLEAARAYGSVFDATDDRTVREHGSFLSSLVLIQIASTQHSQLPARVAERALKKLVNTPSANPVFRCGQLGAAQAFCAEGGGLTIQVAMVPPFLAIADCTPRDRRSRPLLQRVRGSQRKKRIVTRDSAGNSLHIRNWRGLARG